MFKENESPFVEINFEGTEIFYKNIKRIISQVDFNFFVINIDRKLTEKEILFLKQIVIGHSQKTFLIQSFKGKKKIKADNTLFFKKINIEYPLNQQQIFLEDDYDILMLFFDISCSDYNEEQWKDIIMYINTYIKKDIFLVVEASFRDIALKNYYSIIKHLRECEVTISLTSLYKDLKLVIEHPCNAYMCDGTKCHSKKSAYPRYLYITQNGIYPYRCLNENIVFLSDINKKEIKILENEFSEYKNTNLYKNFITCNKRIYLEFVIPRVMKILPWNVLLEYVLNEMLKESD